MYPILCLHDPRISVRGIFFVWILPFGPHFGLKEKVRTLGIDARGRLQLLPASVFWIHDRVEYGILEE
jgi:hypothetical protein